MDADLSPEGMGDQGSPQSGGHQGAGRSIPRGQAEHRRGDTRARIQQVALELFAEQGYEATSLREIAERLGVTKAALYYHFKSKEDIVRSFSEDHFTQMDALIDWARQQPAGPATGHEILERYLTILVEGSDVFRFLEQNQATLRSADAGKHRFEQFRPRLYALVDLITGPDPTTRARIRTTAAFFSISASLMLFRDQADTTPDELRKIILEIAGDLTRDLDAR